jgi:hypothetical protein
MDEDGANLIHDMTIRVESPTSRSISFLIDGEPQKQDMMACGWSGLFGVSPNWAYQYTPVISDPSRFGKKSYAKQVRTAMKSEGVARFPFFTEEEPIALSVQYVLPRRRVPVYDFVLSRSCLPPAAVSFPTFPKQEKDIPHMLTFLVDMMEGILYDDVESIISVAVEKGFPQEDHMENRSDRGWTVVSLSTTPVRDSRTLPVVSPKVTPTGIGSSLAHPIVVD